ncbi:xanthine dehydrogenase family protein molybdopterin-binding subunit [Yoonia sp.]|uniref:xanthine dehydrogenase family protein molybdopterin-binding subunit n=1 Tax=Yoonia sp. TaxID=2212373 RepID=UPI002FD9B4C2
MSRLGTFTRRTFLVGTALVGGAAVFGTYAVARPHPNPLDEDLAEGAVAFNPWIKIDSETITLITPHAEIGQGVEHMQAILMAEELDLDLDQFVTQAGMPAAAYFNGAFALEAAEVLSATVPLPATVLHAMLSPVLKLAGMQGTGGSTSVPDSWIKLRAAAASARETLKLAAAQVHGVDAASLATESGAVILPNGARIRYQDLAATAAGIAPVQDVSLRQPDQWRYIGRPTERIDMVAKCTGTQVYGIDVTAPDMVYATPVVNPRRGPMLSYDASEALAVPGVRDVVEITNGVAIIADDTWAAFKGARAMRFDWGPAPYHAEQDDHWAEAEASFTDDRFQAAWRNDGDVETAIATPAVEALYRAPYIAHQPLEPLGALALVTDDRIEVIAGHQQPTQVKPVLAQVTGAHTPDQVVFHNQHSGGSFGHRLEFEFLRQAVEVANQMRGTPVKLTYSREEDFAQDFPRHLAVARGTGAVANGQVTAISLDVAGGSVFASQMPRANLPTPPGPDSQITAGTFSAPYGNAVNFRVRGYAVPNLAPSSSWRAVGASFGGFMIETLVDELIHAAGADPVAERLRLIDDPVSRQVLQTCAEMANWSGPDRGNGRFAGVALVHSFGVPCAEIVEVEMTDRGIKLHNVWAVADPGTVVDPVNIENHIQGGVVWGLGHAMNSEITYRDGMAEQSNYHAAEGMRLYQAPAIHVRTLQNNLHIRGIGEPPVPPAFPALGNAIFAATGLRLRETPFNKFVDFV